MSQAYDPNTVHGRNRTVITNPQGHRLSRQRVEKISHRGRWVRGRRDGSGHGNPFDTKRTKLADALDRDAADSEYRQRQLCGLGKKCPGRMRRERLGRGRKAWTDAEIIRSVGDGLACFVDRVSRAADDHIAPKHAPGLRHRHVGSAQMHAVGTSLRRDGDTIVRDHQRWPRRSHPSGDCHGYLDPRGEFVVGEILVADLKHPRAGLEQACDEPLKDSRIVCTSNEHAERDTVERSRIHARTVASRGFQAKKHAWRAATRSLFSLPGRVPCFRVDGHSMSAFRYLTLAWPGLPWLWLRGSRAGLVLALAFAVALDVGIVTTFVWPDLVDLPITVAVWAGVCVIWLASTASAAAAFPPPLARPVAADVDPLFVQARDAYLARDWVTAETSLRDLLKLAPTDGEAQLLLATLLRRAGRLAEAREALEKLSASDTGVRWRTAIAAERDRIGAARQGNSDVDEPATIPLPDASGNGCQQRSAAA